MHVTTIVLLLATVPATSDLTGTVTDIEGNPVAGAAVFIYQAGVRSGTSTLCPSCFPDCGKRTKTDPEGRFLIESLDPELLFRVLVAADGHEPVFASKVDPSSGPLTVSLKRRSTESLDRKRTISGRVVNHEGKPVVGAVLEPSGVRRGQTTHYGGNFIEPIAVSDENGKFLVVANADFDGARFQVEARGLAKVMSVELAAGRQDAIIELGPGCIVSGSLHRDGKPIGGAKIGLVQVDRRASDFLGPLEIGTDERGSFLFDNVPPKTLFALYGLIDSMPKGAGTRVQHVKTDSDGNRVDVGAIKVVPDATIKGRVILSDGERIPPGTRIGLYRDKSWDSSSCVIDPDGRFTLRAVPGEVVSLSLRVPGYTLSEKNQSFLAMRENLTGLIQGDQDELLVLLEPGVRTFDFSQDGLKRAAQRMKELERRPLEGVPAADAGSSK